MDYQADPWKTNRRVGKIFDAFRIGLTPHLRLCQFHTCTKRSLMCVCVCVGECTKNKPSECVGERTKISLVCVGEYTKTKSSVCVGEYTKTKSSVCVCVSECTKLPSWWPLTARVQNIPPCLACFHTGCQYCNCSQLICLLDGSSTRPGYAHHELYSNLESGQREAWVRIVLYILDECIV